MTYGGASFARPQPLQVWQCSLSMLTAKCRPSCRAVEIDVTPTTGSSFCRIRPTNFLRHHSCPCRSLFAVHEAAKRIFIRKNSTFASYEENACISHPVGWPQAKYVAGRVKMHARYRFEVNHRRIGSPCKAPLCTVGAGKPCRLVRQAFDNPIHQNMRGAAR